MNKRETKSPIKDRPLRQAGESIRDRLFDVLLDGFLAPALFAVSILIFAVVEWWRYYFKAPPTPFLATTIALVAVAYAVLKGRKAMREVRNLRLGRVGEETVALVLEEKLRPVGCQVLHDIPGKGFNVDHVVIGPTGIFSIETKTHSKPTGRMVSVRYDGETVTVDGLAPDRNPVEQAKAQAAWLRDLLEQSTGKKFPVRPVVVYPGWFVEKIPENAEVWVLNEKAAVTFIANARSKLPPEDVSLATFHLKRYVIADRNTK